MLLVYTDKITNRLGYTLNLIFKDVLGLEHKITTDKDYFIQAKGAKISYSANKICNDELLIVPTELLFQTSIETQSLDYFVFEGIDAIFPTYNREAALPFDVFAASFYLVSRYEEYLPFIQDEFGRFGAKESFVFKNGLLEKPLINIWAKLLKEKFISRYPDIQFENREFHFFNTIDIDSAYSFKRKGLLRNLWGFARDFTHTDFSQCHYRVKVLFGKIGDPFDTFNYQIALIKKYRLKTIFFILFAHWGKYDKNIPTDNKHFRTLIKSLCDYAKIGIHPSFSSFNDPDELTEQINNLRALTHKPMLRSRFHYLKFSHPQSFRSLIDNMISDDYSMGYSTAVGFRSSICTEYNFYDLAIDSETKLREHPFAIMDVAMKNAMSLTPQEAEQKIEYLINQVKAVNGDFISLWHNSSLCENYGWQGWRGVYEKMLLLAANETNN
jgi:hypothetical protein